MEISTTQYIAILILAVISKPVPPPPTHTLLPHYFCRLQLDHVWRADLVLQHVPELWSQTQPRQVCAWTQGGRLEGHWYSECSLISPFSYITSNNNLSFYSINLWFSIKYSSKRLWNELLTEIEDALTVEAFAHTVLYNFGMNYQLRLRMPNCLSILTYKWPEQDVCFLSWYFILFFHDFVLIKSFFCPEWERDRGAAGGHWSALRGPGRLHAPVLPQGRLQPLLLQQDQPRPWYIITCRHNLLLQDQPRPWYIITCRHNLLLQD